MMKHLRRLTIFLTLSAGLLAGPVRAASSGEASADRKGKPTGCLLWRATSGKATVYLLGSIHMAKQDIYPLHPAIQEAFAAANLLVVEANINKLDKMKIQQLVMKEGLYPPGDNIENHLSPETLQALKKHVGEQAFAGMKRMKPWLISLQLALAEMTKLGFDPELGIDKHFLDRAEKRGLEILELESASFQIELFSSFDDALQDLILVKGIADLAEMKQMIDQMMALWQIGDADGMDKLLREEFTDARMKPLYTKMFTDRNVQMTRKIEKYLATDKTYFVVTGAGHMVGEEGIVDLLRKRRIPVVKLPDAAAAAPQKENEEAASIAPTVAATSPDLSASKTPDAAAKSGDDHGKVVVMTPLLLGIVACAIVILVVGVLVTRKSRS